MTKVNKSVDSNWEINCGFNFLVFLDTSELGFILDLRCQKQTSCDIRLYQSLEGYYASFEVFGMEDDFGLANYHRFSFTTTAKGLCKMLVSLEGETTRVNLGTR